MRRFAIAVVALLLSPCSALAQGTRVREPLVIVKLDKRFDSEAAERREGFLELAVRLLDYPTASLDAVRASSKLLSGDTTPPRLWLADARGVVNFGLLPAGDYSVAGVRLGSPETSLVVRIRPGCHTFVELYLTSDGFHSAERNEPRATVTTCPDI
jgi:hypothetical protein